MNLRKGLILAVAAIAAALLTHRLVARQNQSGMEHMHHAQGQPGDMGQMQHDTAENPEAAQGAHESMSHEHMEMNPHMYMTALRPQNPADSTRAEQILEILRRSVEKYRDYHVALAEGYQVFAPNLPEKRKHFTNWGHAYEAEFVFDAARPTSLLYDRAADGGWKLAGAMYTAPKRFTEDQLNDRVPLSVARWHKHVNLCLPPKGEPWTPGNFKKFGLAGSIATEEACQEAGGRWVPQIFGWMVHVYPFETDPAKVWAH
jgi:hypothetical protein